MANYPSDPDGAPGYRRPRRSSSVPSANRWLPPLDDRSAREHPSAPPPPPAAAGAGQKVTVTRAAAQRSREMGSKMYGLVHRAATADGADKSGLTALTWPVVANFAVDAAMAVALANTLFFAAASGESKSKVALYLVITIAPFAVIAPLIGPALDRLQHGRRLALAASFMLRTLLAVVLIANYDGATGSFPPWVLYPCALGMMVLSKSFSVLRSALTPRVLPPTIDLVRVNSRLTTFGLIFGTMIGGAIAAGAEWGFGPVPPARRVVRHRRGHGRRRGSGNADSQVGRGDRGRGPRHAVLPRPERGIAPPPRPAKTRPARLASRWAATLLPHCGATARSR